MPGNLEAVIWDMDGVIADTGPYHLKAWQETFRKRGVAFSEEDFRRHFGQRNDTIIGDTLGAGTPIAEVQAIAAEKEDRYRQLVSQQVAPLPGAIELIKSLVAKGVKMAIASSAPMENIQLITGSLGLADCFQAVVWGGEVTEGKPSPQGFLLAAEKLGVEPGNCLVIEDAVAGVAAAKSAGMKCLAVTNSHPAERLSKADLVVNALSEVTVNGITALFH